MTEDAPINYSIKMDTGNKRVVVEITSSLEITTDLFIVTLRMLADEIDHDYKLDASEIN